jgi:CRISPR-associated protein Cas5d
MEKTTVIFSGPLACFTRPECKADKMSYEVITPSAARNMLQAIHWKPAFQWVIEEIHVLKPIRFIAMTLNEIGSKRPIDNVMKHREQSRNMFLQDVSYGIVARIEMTPGETDPWVKHHEIFQRRAGKGQSFTNPYLGLREFLAEWDLLGSPEEMPRTSIPTAEATKPLGPMLLDIQYTEDETGKVIPKRTGAGPNNGKKFRASPIFFNALMKKGIIQVPKVKKPCY